MNGLTAHQLANMLLQQDDIPVYFPIKDNSNRIILVPAESIEKTPLYGAPNPKGEQKEMIVIVIS